ncbi:unnamed protein product, partial [Citrullus colocynthis]
PVVATVVGGRVDGKGTTVVGITAASGLLCCSPKPDDRRPLCCSKNTDEVFPSVIEEEPAAMSGGNPRSGFDAGWPAAFWLVRVTFPVFPGGGGRV